MRELMKKFWKDEEGATAVEYGVLVALIIAGAVVVIGLVGDKVEDAFDFVDKKVTVPTE